MTGPTVAPPIGNAGTPLPVLDTFDFDAWMQLPKSGSPNGISLRIRNRENCLIEKHNEESRFRTVRCREDRANYPDVGSPMRAFYDYLKHEWMAMAKSDELFKQVGPVPVFVQVGLDKLKEGEKLRGVTGSLVMKNPIARTAGQRAEVAIPPVICQTMACGINIPLHFFLDVNLEKANFQIADLHTKMIAPQPSLDNPSPHKLLVFDMPKMVSMWGSDSTTSVFTPLRWQQASANFLRTLEIMSETVTKGSAKPTFASEYQKHNAFIINIPNLEDVFCDIYHFELEARQELLSGIKFDADHYARRVDSILDAKRAAAAQLVATGNKRQSTYTNLDSRAPKFRRNFNSGRVPSGNNVHSSPNSSTPICLCCAGSHRLADHPPSITAFHDGKPLLCLFRDGNLFVSKSGKTVCITFNLHWGCIADHHSPERIHVCSLCGGNHGALSRHPDCARFSNGRFHP